MANCYGTEKYKRYRKAKLECESGGKWILQDEQSKKYGDYELKYATYSYSLKTSENFAYDRAELTVYRNGKEIYSCTDIYEDSPTFFSFFTRNTNDYLMFRKDDLYGYTILNLDTLEEHNYFPDAVLKGQESFIIVEAKLWKDILLLYGCYWGGWCMYYLLDATTYKTHILRNRSTDYTLTVFDDNTLTVTFDDDNAETKTFNYVELKNLLKNSSTFDM